MSNESNKKYTPQQLRALQEAQEVLDSLQETNTSLDGFNLLGVVANPRAGSHHHERTSSRLSGAGSTHGRSQHGISGSARAAAVVEAAAAVDASSFADSTFHALETTLSSMTEQIDVLNDTLEYWSRQYLGVYDEATEVLEYTPPELSEEHDALPLTDLQSLQAFLESCGKMADSFTKRQESQQQQQTFTTLNDDELVDFQSVQASIAPLFFEDDFDLTDPNTFMKLLVDQDNDEGDSQQQQQEDSTSENAALSVPTSELLRLPPPDYFTPSLDRVEVALLHQVREKSTRFFHETNRFGLLQEWIASLVVECKRVRSLLHSLQTNSVQAWELIPQLDNSRKNVEKILSVLNQAQEVIRAKASIGGLLHANQDLHAAQTLQYCKSLLATPQVHGLVALSTVEQQLSQYQALVVSNLANELIEVFLDFYNSSQQKNRVPELIQGLELCHALEETFYLYSNRLMDVIRMTVRTTVGEFAEEKSTTVKAGVTSMTLERFLDCLDLMFEQVGSLLRASVSVKEYCVHQSIVLENEEGDSLTEKAVLSAAELTSKSISELLRLRKDAHSLVSLEEMKRLWDVCMSFTTQLENLTNYKATGLRSTLLAQAKSFVERKHESDKTALKAALELERWTRSDVSAERQEALTRLSLGRAVIPVSTNQFVSDIASHTQVSSTGKKKMRDAEVEGVHYKVVWSCLLLVEMVISDIACTSQFKALGTNMVGKVAELLRLFNNRATELVLEAGSIHSAARLKSINAKHLSIVTQCVGLIISILPQIRAALMAQLPAKQHTLLNDFDAVKREYEEHEEKVLNKFVSIIGGIVERGLALSIGGTNFDERAKQQLPEVPIACCTFLEGTFTTTQKMHQVLSSQLPPVHLQDSFSRIFAYLDQKIPEFFLSAVAGVYPVPPPPNKAPPPFLLPSTDQGKKQMLLEVKKTTDSLNELVGVRPWDFSAVGVLEQELDYKLAEDVSAAPLSNGPASIQPSDGASSEVSDPGQSSVADSLQNDGVSDAGESKQLATDKEGMVETCEPSNTANTSTGAENGSQNASANGLNHHGADENANGITANENGGPMASSEATGESDKLGDSSLPDEAVSGGIHSDVT